jgi:tRNA(Ile)-lysidine synthase
MPGVLAKVSAALRQLLSPERGARLGVAVSGGPDSVALLGALVVLAPRRQLQLTVVHVNHALRPEADQEQQFVEALCQRWRIPCIVEKLTRPEKPRGIEAWARQERYRFFYEVKERCGLDVVAVAHTSDDQAETVLFRLVRGAGHRGLAGMSAKRDGWLIRPLLTCSRQEVLAYLAAKHLPSVTDASNTDLRYTRNKIRHVLIPLLEREFSPQIRRHLVRLAESLRHEEEWLEAQARLAYSRVQAGWSSLALDRLQNEPSALHPRIFRLWLEQSGVAEVSFPHLKSLSALSEGRIAGTIEIPGGRLVRRERQTLAVSFFRQAEPVLSPYSYPLFPGEVLTIAETGWQCQMSLPLSWNGSLSDIRPKNLWQAVFDASALAASLTVRTVQPGDRMRPLGMQGRKKVHDIFIEKKITPGRRHCWPLVVHGAEIVWAPGLVRGAFAQVTAATRQVVRITVNPLPENQKLC